MKKIKLLFYSSILVLSSSLLNAQSWMWGEAGYGTLKSYNYASPVTTDPNGNAYVTGNYTATIIFGQDTLDDTFFNAFLVKYNPAGTVMWTKQIVDTNGLSYGTSVATDESGNIYLTGFFAGNALIDTVSLTSNANVYTAYIAKYNSRGRVLWAKQSQSTSINSVGYPYSVATDKFGNAFITGYFEDTISFGRCTLICNGMDAFIVKYDSNGNVLWAQQSQNNEFGAGYSVTADNAGNSYLAGYFYDHMSFGTITLVDTIGEYSGFLAKYSPSGNVLWAKQTLNGSANSVCVGNSVITDNADNAYITGNFEDTVQFGSEVLYSPSKYSLYLTKYDTGGNVLWVKQSSTDWEGTALASDRLNHIYLAGFSYSTLDSLSFDNYTLYPNSLATNASFLVKFDTSGIATCGSIINNVGGQGSENGVASDSTGTYVYTAGMFENTVYCGSDTLLWEGGGENAFIGKWLDCQVATSINILKASAEIVNLYPNPNNGQFTIQLSGVKTNSEIEIYNILGEKVFTENLHSVQGDNIISMGLQSSGMYLYRIISENGQLIGDGKFVIEN
jgi:hypothetical protein